MLSIFSKPAIATRITNQLVRTSLGTQLSRKTKSILAFVPIVANNGVTTTVKFGPCNQFDNSTEESYYEESINYIASYQQLYDQVYDSN